MEREIIDLTPKTMGERLNARRMIRWYGGEIRFCDDAGKWVKYNGKYWEVVSPYTIYNYVEDTLETMETASRNAKAAATKEMDALPEDDPARKEKQAVIKNHAKVLALLPKFMSDARIRGTVNQAKSCEPFKMSEFDKDPYLLNCANGVLNLKNFQFVPHDSSQRFMQCTGTDYRPDVDASFWNARVAEILPVEDVRRWVQMYIGYCLTGLVIEAIFPVFVGNSQNGKSTFVQAVCNALGSYVDTIKAETFLGAGDRYNDGSRATPNIAKLMGKRFVVCEEVNPGRALNVATLKNQTGGADVTARDVYAKPVTFTPTYKFVMSVNDLPYIKDTTDGGTIRRLVAVPFVAKFQHPRKHLGEELQTPENRAAILQWAVEGLKMYWNTPEGLDARPPEIIAATKDWLGQDDVIGAFLHDPDFCQLDPEAAASSKELWSQYRMWWGETHAGNTTVISSLSSFSRRLKAWNPDKVQLVHTRAGSAFRGVRLTYRGQGKFGTGKP